uniref:Uncharacterized protein n=1 Tax=Utricularia reniformis TaxID=192314 RepID=A0A1Y0B2G2_9LAMI|nr:hypothetical protein AEK19_MT1355 [Utricularia reniformis]ART31553.1 hypothetical protein AEK19_MT1355 [Utricularia reniformis]
MNAIFLNPLRGIRRYSHCPITTAFLLGFRLRKEEYCPQFLYWNCRARKLQGLQLLAHNKAIQQEAHSS